MDIEKYKSEINKNLPKLKDLLNSKTQSLTQTVRDTMDILNSTAEKCSNQRKYGKNKLKWNIWNNNIKEAIKHNKIAHKDWKEAGKPKCPQNLLVLHKIETRKIYRLEIRKKESKRKHEERDKIINAQTHNKKVFYQYQMIRKQRNNRNVVIDDLYVGNNNYDGDNILKGWHEHFQTLAQPADDPSYNIQYKQQCQTDYNNIKDIYKNIPPKIITMKELENAIKAINTGKSEDIYGLSIENIIYAGEGFQQYMLDLINNIISQYSIPELIEIGLLSPIYKNKGDKNRLQKL